MRWLTTIAAGWVSLAVAYVLSAAVCVGLGALFFAAGCNDAAHALAPSLRGLCDASGPGPAVQYVAHAVMLLVIAVGTVLAIIAAVAHLAATRGGAPRAWALLITTSVAIGAVILVEIVLGPSNWAILLASLAGLICVAIVGPISSGVAVLIVKIGHRSGENR